MASLIDRAASFAVMVAALAVAASVVRRELGSSPNPPIAAPRHVEEWREVLPIGIRTGNKDAAVKLIEFTDYECPFCARYQAVLTDVQRDYGESVELIYVHAPLAQHRFAVPAARVVECAHAQGKFNEMQGALYARQDSFGLRPWARYAEEVGIADIALFTECAEDSVRVERIHAGTLAAERFRVPGTPTLLINGWLFTGLAPDSLRSVIDAQLRVAGK